MAQEARADRKARAAPELPPPERRRHTTPAPASAPPSATTPVTAGRRASTVAAPRAQARADRDHRPAPSTRRARPPAAWRRTSTAPGRTPAAKARPKRRSPALAVAPTALAPASTVRSCTAPQVSRSPHPLPPPGRSPPTTPPVLSTTPADPLRARPYSRPPLHRCSPPTSSRPDVPRNVGPSPPPGTTAPRSPSLRPRTTGVPIPTPRTPGTSLPMNRAVLLRTT